MIVKNESSIIRETLENLVSHLKFDYWVISDTGSTDDTPQIITDFFKEKNIPGELCHDTWKDFGHNRTLALEHAYQKSDYLLIFDADDKIVGSMNLDLNTLDLDSYALKLVKGAVFYRPLLITNRKRWKFVGVLHEYLQGIDPMNGASKIDGDYYVNACTDGCRSHETDKYKKDADLLKRAYEVETDPSLKARYCFYSAQSFKDSQQDDEAIEWYQKVFDHCNWIQEKYYAALMLGHLYESKKQLDQAIHFFTKTSEYDLERIDGIVNACRLYYEKGNHLLVHVLYEKFKGVELSKLDLSSKLFLSECYYQDELSYYNSISAYYLKHTSSGYECCKRNLVNQRVPLHRQYNAIDNLYYYRDEIPKDPDTGALFQRVRELLVKKGLSDRLNDRELLILELLDKKV
jgi:glycosyltransferase involved in cell wall biosynthesis